MNVGLDAFEGIVFGRRNLFQGSRVNDDIDLAHGHFQTVAVAHIADEETQYFLFLRREVLGHVVLFGLVPAENDEPFRPVARQNRLHEMPPKRSGSPGHENRLVRQVYSRGVKICFYLGHDSPPVSFSVSF